MIGAITGIIGLAKTVFGSWTERKKIVSQGKIAITQAKVDGRIKQIQTKSKQDALYNETAVKGMASSWKDELFVIVWLSIVVSCFIPWTQPYVKEGFLFLKDNTPYWFEWSLLGMVAASFGLKGWKMWKM